MKMTRTVHLGDVEVEWAIRNFSEINDKIHATDFLLSDAKWQICLRPNGATQSGENGWISLNLERISSVTENHRVIFSMGIRKSDGSVFEPKECEYEFTRDTESSGWSHFIEYSKLLEMKDVLLQKDMLKIVCAARLLERNTGETASQTLSPDDFETLIGNFEDLYRKKHFCDFVIRFKDREFQVHESILSARSPVFAAMFKYEMLEKKSGVVDIVDCDSNSFEDVLLYLYTGKMDKVSSDNVFELYMTADKYELKELSAKCIQYIARDLSVDSFCDSFLIAVMHNETDLLESVTEFFIKNVKAILPTTKWLSFLKSYPTFGNELVMKSINKN